MPRRKRTTEDGGRRAKVSRVEHIEETVVLSDSEHEEGEDCAPKSSSRAARCKRRENESQLQEMTEDEMMALAMRLSAQEANTAAQRQQQLEDDEIQKAIAESLHDSSRKSSANRNHAASSSAQPQQSFDDVMLHLRRKLSYPSKDDAQSGEESPAAYGDENERETSSPLPEMPDLSQTTPSHLSLSHSAPHANSQHVCESSQSHTADEQPISRDSQLSQSVSQPRFSPVFHSQGSLIRQPLVCVERLSQDVIRATTDSRDHLLTQDSAQDSSQDSPPPKSPVFSKTDYKGSADFIKDTDERSTAEGNDTASTPIPDVDGDLPTHQSHKGLSPEKCLSPSGGSQPSSPRCVPESDSADVTIQSKSPELKQGKDQVTRGENETADSERPANTVETHSWEEYTSHMVLHLTDDDDESEEDDGPHSPSPVFDKEPARPKISPTQPCVTPAEISHAKSPSSQDAQTSQRALQEDSRPSRDPEPKACGSKIPRAAAEAGERTVSYYWGVPFCPLGQNPDDYTQVILAQMEVYEKSLKEAQRGLLRKTDWGQPVFPSERPFGTRRWKRHRAPQLSEDEEENVEEKENDRIEVEEEEQQQQEKEVVREPSVVGSEEGAEGGQSETYVVLSSPETKDEQSQKSADFTQKELTAASRSIRKNGHTSDDTQIQHPDEQEEEEAQDHEGFDDERMVCPETQMTENSTPELMMTSPASPTQPQSRADSEVMEVEEEGGSPVLEDVVMEQEGVPAEAVAAAPHSQQVECPMCSKLFPLSRVEMHAAYCDGGGEDQDHQEEQVISQRTRTRRDVTEDAFHRSVKSAEMEKCYVCKGSFPHQEYLKHVSLCFRKNKPKTKQGNGLLSALAQTERRHTRSDEAGPSNISIKNTSGLADSLGNAAGGSVDRNASSSPSQAFTAPLEDTDCLIDFTQQDSKNSQRLSRKRKFKR